AALRAAFCTGTRAHSFEWTPVPRDTQGRSPCTSLENVAHTGTLGPSTVAISSAGGVPLEVMALARVRIPLCGWCGCTDFCADLQRHHPHRCEPSL
ncbi:unnamed protein product, partial [Staurois parvus]